ncbi:MAG: porin [Caldimonas sp.]
MKKSLLALAVFGAYAGVASAQSSVTLYGTLDVNGRYVKADGQSRRYSEGTDGINSSQLGFRGVEDLGGGLKAGFTILSSIGVDAGTIGSGTGTNKFWNRRSTISLLGGFGEVRLGRDYTPTFWNQTIFDAMGTNGLGDSTGVRQLYAGTRMDNSIGYFLPSNIGGFYGQAMVAAAEGGTTLDRPGRYVGARVGFAAGPFDISFAGAQQRFGIPFGVGTNGVSAVTTALPGQNQKTFNIGGSWDFGFLKLLAYYDRETLNSYRENMGSISTVIPLGQAEVHLAYDRSKLKNAAGNTTSVDKIAATYQYNLSKRTAMYATIARESNKDGTRLTLPGAAGATTASGKSSGAEFGLRHFF